MLLCKLLIQNLQNMVTEFMQKLTIKLTRHGLPHLGCDSGGVQEAESESVNDKRAKSLEAGPAGPIRRIFSANSEG